MKVEFKFDKISITGESAREIIDVAKEVVPMLYTHLVNLESATEIDEQPLTALLKTEPEKVQVEEKPYIPTHVPRKRLVFTKCEDCGTTFCQMIDLEGVAPVTMTCHCGCVNSVSELRSASYVCDCGQVGYFKMTENVSTVKCRTCKKEFYLVQDSETGEYEGKPL